MQLPLLHQLTSARSASPQQCDQVEAQRALDELFSVARKYRTTEAYRELLKFISGFRSYSPFNALLIHIQMPGATFVAPPRRWLNQYGHRIKTDSRPLVILQPMGPVMFVFDASQTEPGPNAKPLPRAVKNPFAVRAGQVGKELMLTVENAKRDGVRIHFRPEGSQSAGSIRTVSSASVQSLLVQSGRDEQRRPVYESVPVRYDLLMNESLSRESQYATLAHELGHLYCGHLGTPDEKWWPNRERTTHPVCEFEAESVAYLICQRLGIDNPSEEYLAGYCELMEEVPNISLECIMKAVGLIEQMGRAHLKARKDRPRQGQTS